MKDRFCILLIIVVSILTLLVLIVNLRQPLNLSKFNPNQIDLIDEGERNKQNLWTLDQYGYINIINVTIDKLSAEIGENVTVSTVYSLICNEGYEKIYGLLGLSKSGRFEFRDCLIDDVLVQNVTTVISINPNQFDANDNCIGRAEIKVANIIDIQDFKIYFNLSNEYLELRKANLNYIIVDQNPMTIFSQDIINFSILIHNQHDIKFGFSSQLIEINVTNKDKSLNFSQITDSHGFLNFSLDCSILGAGNYTLQLSNYETEDYESGTQTFQLEVYNETSSINCSLLNEGEVYVSVKSGFSNFSTAFFIIESKFNASINWSSTFGNGEFIKNGKYYEGMIKSPNQTGSYQITFTVKPITSGKEIELFEMLHVKRRPIELDSSFSREINQSILVIHVNITDKLNSQFIESSSTLNISILYNDSIQELGPITINPNISNKVTWKIPNRIIEDYITFSYNFMQNQVYQGSNSSQSLIVTNLEYLGPLSGFITKNYSIKAKLFTLNGSSLSNKMVYLRIGNKNYSLRTNLMGEILYIYEAPSFSTSVEVEIQFPGSLNILSSHLIFNIQIKLNILHQIWNSLGYILLGITSGIILVVYLKRLFNKRNLENLSVD